MGAKSFDMKTEIPKEALDILDKFNRDADLRMQEKNVTKPKANRRNRKFQGKPHKERRGVITRLCEEQGLTGNRQSRRMQAKVFKADPLNFVENFGPKNH